MKKKLSDFFNWYFTSEKVENIQGTIGLILVGVLFLVWIGRQVYFFIIQNL